MNITRYRALQIMSFTLLSLFLLTQAAVAESDSLISFESEEPIAFSYDISKSDDPESSQNDDLVVRIFNNTAESFTLDVQISDFDTEDKLSEVLSIDSGKTAASLNGSEIAALFFLVDAQPVTENKTYTGELYITAEGVGDATKVEVIHQRLSLEFTAVPPAPSSLTLQNSPSYLTEVVFEGTNSQPTAPLLLIILSLATLLAAFRLWERAHRPIVLTVLIIAMLAIAGAFFLGGGVKIAPIVLDGATVSESETQVGFVSANSQIVPITQNGSQYSIEGISGAGHYTGNIDLLPDDKDKAGGIAVKVNVKDAWPYAILAIALGTLVGFLLKEFYINRPTRVFNISHASVKEKLNQELRLMKKLVPGLEKDFLALLKQAMTRIDESNDDLENAQSIVDKLKGYAERVSIFNDSLRIAQGLDRSKQVQTDQMSYEDCLKKLKNTFVDPDDYDKEKKDSTLESFYKEIKAVIQNLRSGNDKPRIKGVWSSPEREESSETLRTRLNHDDTRVAILAALLAVVTGFATLYTKADVTFWGTPGTYLTAFLWGAGVAEGSKLAVDIVSAIWKKVDK